MTQVCPVLRNFAAMSPETAFPMSAELKESEFYNYKGTHTNKLSGFLVVEPL